MRIFDKIKEPTRNFAEIMLILTTAIWGSTFVIIKLLTQNISAFSLLFLRFSLATILSFIIFRFKNSLSKVDWIGGLVVGFLGFCGYALQTIGLFYTTPAKSGFITSLFVIFIPFVSHLWEKVNIPANVYVALIPAVFGLWAISGVGKSMGTLNIGDIITFFSALSYAFQIVAIQIYTRFGNWRWIVVVQFGSIAFFSSLGAIVEALTNRIVFVANLSNILGVLYLASVASVGALGVQMFAQRFTTSARASFIYIAEPIFALLFSWLVAGMGMSGMELIGAGAILLSTFIGIYKGSNR